MHNDKKTISASEVNRYLHCPYQWYYERYYGRKHLNAARKELNEALGIEVDSRLSFLKKGLNFHDNFGKKSPVGKILFWIILVIILLALGYLFYV